MTDETQAAREAREAPTPFMMLCGSLGAQVHMALGLIPDPTTQKGKVEFDAARQGIQILEDLEAKTKGNLDANEQKLMTDLLAQLKMIYVEVHKIHAQSQADAAGKGESAPPPDDPEEASAT